MKISVITINYNNGEQLEATIQSVVSNVTVLRELLGEKAEYIVMVEALTVVFLCFKNILNIFLIGLVRKIKVFIMQ